MFKSSKLEQCIIAKDSVCGNLSLTNTKLVLKGTAQNVTADEVEIEATGVVLGSIDGAKHVVVGGKVFENINCPDAHVVILRTGWVNGEIECASLLVESGANLRVTLSTGDRDEE